MAGRHISDKGGYPGTSDAMMKSKTHLKEFHSAEGSGHVGTEYDDTTEKVRETQMKGDSKIKGDKMKPGYRY